MFGAATAASQKADGLRTDRRSVRMSVVGGSGGLLTDEAENIAKYEEIIEMLLAAGYFRVRISTLSPFDKVVGGMAWSIMNSNVDLDLDLSFQEESNIGQKIKMSEDIIRALQRMKCPYIIQPQQIQGLDNPQLYPVIQWLVKKVFETRKETAEGIRRFAALQFNRSYELPADVEAKEKREKATPFINEVESTYNSSQRRFRRRKKIYTNEQEHVQAVLLEYGRQFRRVKEDQVPDQADKQADDQSKERLVDDTDFEAEEQRIQEIMSNLDQIGNSRVKENLGRIVGLGSDDIMKESTKYRDRSEQLENEKAKIEKGMNGEQLHRRLVAALTRQVEVQQRKMEEISAQQEAINSKVQEAQTMLAKAKKYNQRVEREIEKIDQLAKEDVDQAKLKHLVSLNESLKQQEQEFRANCKKQLQELKDKINKLNEESQSGELQDYKEITATYEADMQKYEKIQAILSKKNRDIILLQRAIDDVPTRTELIQYERRFRELYDQVSSKLQETRKYFDTYNTLEQTRNFLSKEMSLLNSIHDSYQSSSKAKGGKEWLVDQVNNTLSAIEQTKQKHAAKLQEEKAQRDTINEQYTKLLAKQRAYYKAVKEFKEECTKNEALSQKLKEMGK